MAASELPMFPLGTNVFPLEVLPLQVFEPRYLRMIEVIESRPAKDFGVVLIDRGSEVGGGDVRTMVGTRVELLESQEVAPNRHFIAVVGIERLDVVSWLEDDPFPRATVQPRLRTDTGGDLEMAEFAVREAISVSLDVAGVSTRPDLHFSDDPLERLDQLSAVAPLSAFDRQKVLESPTSRDQIAELRVRVEDKLSLLRATMDLG